MKARRVVMQVVFLHGLGDTAHGWSDAMAMLAKDLTHVKFILPTGESTLGAGIVVLRSIRPGSNAGCSGADARDTQHGHAHAGVGMTRLILLGRA